MASRRANHEMEPVVETLLWLCEIPSFIGEEGPLCDAVIARLAHVPLAAPIRRYQNSIVVPLTRGGRGPHVVLAGHLDVVRTSHEAPPRIEGDKLFGPGASDMKSGLACMLAVAERHRAAIGETNLTLVFYAREEGPYLENELGVVLAEDAELRAVDLAVCLEPSDNKLSLGATGSIHATVTFEGRTSHSARPWQGDNAIHKAGAFLTELAALAPEVSILDGMEYRSVVSATLAEGGRGRNIVPDRFQLNLNHRFAPDRTLEDGKARIEALVAGRARVELTDLSPSAPPFRTHPLVTALMASGVRAVEPKQAWTDVARFAALGVPAVNFGPGTNAQAHQKNEWTHVPDLIEGEAILVRWLSAVGAG